MPEYARVRDEDTGHELSVPVSAVPHGNYVVLDEPAVNVADEPLPPKHRAPKFLSSKPTKSGQSADPEKENADG